MLAIILTILMVGAFFMLFFTPSYTEEKEEEEEEEKEEEEEESSNAVGYIEDTGLDSYGAVFEKGDMGTFVPHESETSLSGSPVLKHIEG